MTARADNGTDTTGQGRLPDFVILGAMKAGSTTLWRYLIRHPQIFMPTDSKEPQFFSRDQNFEKGEDWYRQLFLGAGPSQICGEASTCYSRYPAYPMAASRMAALVPQVKLIYVLRHPVERLYSHYVHEMSSRFVRQGGKLPSFQRFASEDEEARCASRYSFQIDHLTRYFDPSQLLIVLTDDLEKQPARVLADVQSFLEVDYWSLTADRPEYANTSIERVNRTPKMIWGRRMKTLRRNLVIKRLIDGIPTPVRRKLRADLVDFVANSYLGRWQAGQLKSKLSPLSTQVRWQLCREYAHEARSIGARIGRDLNAWLW